MESLLKSPMKLVLLTAWLSSVMDPCSLSDICDSCHQLATCKALNGSNNACFCKHGYTGDGTTFCKDKLEPADRRPPPRPNSPPQFNQA